jgi:hypothetical protein
MNGQDTHGSQRFADSQTAQNYPLPCSGDLTWQKTHDTALCRLRIGHISAGSIIIPSLSIPSAGDYAYEVDLIHGDTRWSLPPVPNSPNLAPRQVDGAAARISTHVDCFHVHQPSGPLTLEYRVRCSDAPEHYLVTATWRPLQIEAPVGPQSSVCCTPPPALSQISQGGSLGPRICSPACLCMALRGYHAEADLMQIAEECYDPATNLYGVWPNAIRAAARRGFVGATEAFASWADAERVLAHGYPLIASVRFASGKLPGAPLEATRGHLMLIHGTSPECVVVNDPAAPQVASVPRTYDAEAFTRAWLSYRGAAYILLP